MDDNETKIDDGSRIDPGHKGIRNVLRVVGPILLFIAVGLIATAFINFAMAFGGSEPPRLFWCFFLAFPFLIVGAPMTQFGYMGKVARYAAGEVAPVGKDTFNYMATESKEGITAVASAIGAGLKEGGISLGGETKESIRCHKCNGTQDADAKFCDDCGAGLLKSKECPGCDELNDPDAKFCDECGYQF